MVGPSLRAFFGPLSLQAMAKSADNRLMNASQAARSPARAELHVRLLWLTLGLSGVAAVWSWLRSPLSLLVVLPGVAMTTFMLWERRSEEKRRERPVAALPFASVSALQLEGGIQELLVSARRLFHAEYAEILVLPDELKGPAHRNSSTRAGDRLMMPERLLQTDELSMEAARRRGQPVLGSRSSNDPDLVAALEARDLSEAIVGIVRASNMDLGLAVVGNVTRSEAGFVAADAALFAAFCGHAGVVLEIARLGRSLEELTEVKERLHHQAFHDALTGLPNRVLFAERVAEAINRSRSGGREH